MTVGELREALASYADDTPVLFQDLWVENEYGEEAWWPVTRLAIRDDLTIAVVLT